MMIKEQIKKIIKEHRLLKEQLIDDVSVKMESMEEDEFSKLTENILGTAMTKEQFKEQVANGELPIEDVQKIEEALSTLNEDEEDNMTKKESDGVTGDHKDPTQIQMQQPTSPAEAGDGVAGAEDKSTSTGTPVTGNTATDGSEGEHKAETMDEEDDTIKREEYDEMKEAIEVDLLNLLKDLIAKVKELEVKISGMEQPVDGAESMDNEIEPQPPVTQESFNGVKPLSYNRNNEKNNIARSVGKSFFESRSKR